jgi:uncharacterized protein DUF4399
MRGTGLGALAPAFRILRAVAATPSRELRKGIVAALIMVPTAVSGQGTPSPKDAYLYIISPADGETVKGTFWCRFGLRNMGVSHAGDNFGNTGHHHLLIDADDSIDPGEPIPQDKKHLHYGGGETEALIELPPGKHTLQLVLSDGKHFNFDPPVVSKKITITVSGADVSDKNDETGKHRHARLKHHTRITHGRVRESTADATPATQEPSAPIKFISRVLGMSK